MKVIRKDKILKEEMLDNIIFERKTLIEAKHPFLVHLIYGFQTEERLFFVMDYV